MAKKTDAAPTSTASTSALPEGFEGRGESLRDNFEIDGYLSTRAEKGKPVKFSGIMLKAVPWKDQRGNPSFFYVFRATSDQPSCTYTTPDGEIVDSVKKGDVVTVSHSGALAGLDKKVGYFCQICWTGEKKSTPKGDMWIVEATCYAPKAPAGSPADATDVSF